MLGLGRRTRGGCRGTQGNGVERRGRRSVLLLKSGGRNLDDRGIANTLKKVVRHIEYRRGEMWKYSKSMI